MNENGSEFGAFLAGFVIGGLVGAAAALILAPQSGSETRSQIVGKSHDLREAGDRRVHQAVDTAGSLFQGDGESDEEIVGQDEQQSRIILDSGIQQSNGVENAVDASTTE